MKYLVTGAGRTGSIMIARAIAAHLGKQVQYDYSANDFPDVVHTHDHDNIIGDGRENWTLVISHRRSTFLAVISQCVTLITGEHNNYSNKKISPTPIALNLFRNLIKGQMEFYDKINKDGYAAVVDIVFCDVIANPYLLFDHLGYPNTLMPVLTSKCPYRGEDVISNYSELEAYYLENY